MSDGTPKRQSFRDFYVERHGVWPAHSGERYETIIRRLFEAGADYFEAAVARHQSPITHPADGANELKVQEDS